MWDDNYSFHHRPFTEWGESFRAGDQVTVRWTSVNIAPTSVISATLINENLNIMRGIEPQNMINSEVAYITANDGQEVFTLPASWITDVYGYGTNFKIQLKVHDTRPGGLPGGVPGGYFIPINC